MLSSLRTILLVRLTLASLVSLFVGGLAVFTRGDENEEVWPLTYLDRGLWEKFVVLFIYEFTKRQICNKYFKLSTDITDKF